VNAACRLLLGALLLVGPVAAIAAPDPQVEAISARVDLQSQTGRLALGGAAIVSRTGLAAIYGAVGFRPLWQRPPLVDQLLALVAASYDDGLSPVDYHLTALLRLRQAVRSQPGPAAVADLDVAATDAFMLLLEHLYFGKVGQPGLQPAWHADGRLIEGRPVVDFVRDAILSGRLHDAVDAVRPSHWMYRRGVEWLRHYRDIAADGGWPVVPEGPTLDPGMRDPRILALRRRLAVSGDLVGQPLDDDRYDEPLAVAVRHFQARHRLEPDARVGKATLRELDVPVAARIDQIRANLERGRHVLHEIGDEDLVIVDIAGYELRYVQNRRVTWTTRVQVGLPYRQTPVFKSAIDHVIVNPTWTVPPTILGEDVLPAVRRDRSYLARHGLDVIDRDGRRIDPATVAWNRYDGRSFPYFLRQAAGPDNALGRVKILFPNPYSVYLHETPHRSLFGRQDRAFSSGCIRVEQPFELVRRLLHDPAWDAAALERAVASGQTQTIRLAHPVKLLVIYWTVDEDDHAHIVFKRDVYARDAPLLRALDTRFAPAAPASP